MSKCKLALNAILVLLLFLPFAHAAVSEEQVQSVGGSSLTDAMPNSARQYLDGVSPENADTLSDSVSRVLENMTSDSQSAIRTALGGLLRVAVIVLLASVARGFSAAAGGEANDWIDMAAALGCAAVLLRDFTGVLSLCRDTLDQIGVFSGTLQPVLATVLATGGNTATATVLQAATMVVFDLVIRLVNALLVPAACAYLAITAVDAAAGNGRLCRRQASPLGQLHHGAEKRHGQADAYGAGAAPASLCGVSSGRAGEHFLRGAAPRKKGGACRAEMGI